MTTLRQVTGEARPALSTRRDGADQDTVADFVAGDTNPQLLNHADGLMSDHESGLHRILAADDVQVGAADRRRRDLDQRFAGTNAWTRNFLDADVADAMKDGGAHRVRRKRPRVLLL
jgi:hypothetical protein